MKKVSLILIFMLAFIIYFNESASILVIVPFPYISHHRVYDVLIQALANNGHEIYTITARSKQHIKGNINETDIGAVTLAKLQDAQLMKHKDSANDPIDGMRLFADLNEYMFDGQLSLPSIRTFFKDECKGKFDVIIVEYLAIPYYAASTICETPIIVISTLMMVGNTFEELGNPAHPYLYPDVYSTLFTNKMNIAEKIEELYKYYRVRETSKYYENSNNRLIEKYFKIDPPKPTSDKLLILNNDVLLLGVRPLAPQLIAVSNFHHLNVKKPLEPKLLKYLDEAFEGVVYFSLGSTVSSKDLPGPILGEIKTALGELPYKVLWKWEENEMSGKPSNVYISKWFPQNDLMDHHNIKVFVTQGGLQSLEEAIFNRVPMVGIPIIADQDYNVQRLCQLGIGRRLDLNSLSKDSLKDAILEVGENKTYKRNIEKFSVLLRDQPMTSLERAVWWVEYVARRGTRAMRAPATDASLSEFFMLDVLALLTLIVTIANYVVYRVAKTALNRFVKFKSKVH